MKPSTHRYVLPPVLLGIHLILLLPLILSPTKLRQPHFPNSEGRLWPGYGPEPGYFDHRSRLVKLCPQYSIPLGIIGILGVYFSKQLAGKIPLPKDERRKRLAQVIEWSVLFGMGVMEEVWRWGLVRLLILLEHGHGGYRGRASSSGKSEGIGTAEFVEISSEYLSLWEGLYLMGWVWSLIECLVCKILQLFVHLTLISCFPIVTLVFLDPNIFPC